VTPPNKFVNPSKGRGSDLSDQEEGIPVRMNEGTDVVSETSEFPEREGGQEKLDCGSGGHLPLQRKECSESTLLLSNSLCSNT
jgi:hypothetical protein